MNSKRQAQRNESRQALLRKALGTNAVFSGLSGMGMVLVPGWLSERLGIGPVWLISLIGVGLLMFSAELFFQVGRRRLMTWRALLASVGDFLWVAGSAVVLALGPESLTGPGYWAIGGVALVVALMGVLQVSGIHRIHFDPVRKRHRHCVRIESETSVENLWAKIGDLGTIQKYYPSLKSSQLRDGQKPGVDAVRECTDRKGRTWAERCSRYVEGKLVELEFLADEPGFPFPAREMRGGWTLFPQGEGCEVEIWWEMRLKRFLPGVVIMPLLAIQADRGMLKTVRLMAGGGQGEGSTSESYAEGIRISSIPC